MTISKEQNRSIYNDLASEAYNIMQDILEDDSTLFPELFLLKDKDVLTTDRPEVEYMEVDFYQAIELKDVLDVALEVNMQVSNKKLNDLIDQMEDLETKI